MIKYVSLQTIKKLVYSRKGGFTIITKNEIGTLIRQGITTKEMQKEISDFTTTTEYFEKLGYKHVEAIRLKWILRQNDNKEEEEEKEVTLRRALLQEKSYIFSSNANPNNILIDTCALGFQKSIELIERSEHVTLIHSILEEMEKKKKELEEKRDKNEKECFFLGNIIKYKKEVSIKSKYKLILDKHKGALTYEDDNILEFLEQLEEDKRPTLLTADEFLADRAKCYGFEYILIVNRSIIKSNDKDDTQNSSKPNMMEELNTIVEPNMTAKPKNKEDLIEAKEDILGVKIKLLKDDQIKIQKTRSSLKIYFAKGEKIEEIARIVKISITDFDYIAILKKDKKHKEVKVVKVTIVEREIKKEVFDCKFINEIYKIDIAEQILDKAKTLLTT